MNSFSMNRAHDPTPAYFRIYRTLHGRIETGAYPATGQLPTEEKLMEEFGVSRHTIRAAVQQLVQQGLVRRQAGKGSFVLSPEAESQHWVAQSLEDMVDRGFRGRMEAPALSILQGDRHPKIAAKFGLGADATLACFSWLRVSEAGPYAFAKVYVPHATVDRFPANWADLLHTTRLLHLIERHCGVRALRARQVSSATAASRDVARRLKVPHGTPLLTLERTYFGRNGEVIEYAIIHGRPDRYQQTVELFRADHKIPQADRSRSA